MHPSSVPAFILTPAVVPFMLTRYITTSLAFHFLMIIVVLTFGFIQPPVHEKPTMLMLNLNSIPLGLPDAPENGGGEFRPGPTPAGPATPVPAATEAKPPEISAPTPPPPPPKPVEEAKPKTPEPKPEPPVKKSAGKKDLKEVVSKSKEIVEKPDIALPSEEITPTPTPAGKDPKGEGGKDQEGRDKAKDKKSEVVKEKGVKLPEIEPEPAKPAIDLASVPKEVRLPEVPKAASTPAAPAVSTPAVQGAGGVGISELAGGTGTGGVDGPGAGTNPGGIPGARRGLPNGDPNGGWSLGPTYAQTALFFIEQNFHPPYSVPGLKTVVAFRILKDGTIDANSIRVVTSSGKGDLDQSGVGAIRKTAKLPPLYEQFGKTFMDVAVTFEFDKKNG